MANSSYGPVADGRIKPDLIATDFVIAPLEYHTYGNSSGSSFATPLVAGVAALLYQHFRNLNDGRNPERALIKAFLMNSADYMASREEEGKRPGGLGVHLIRNLMDDFKYNDRGNMVMLTKLLDE